MSLWYLSTSSDPFEKYNFQVTVYYAKPAIWKLFLKSIERFWQYLWMENTLTHVVKLLMFLWRLVYRRLSWKSEWRPEDLPTDIPDFPLSRQVANWLNVGHAKQCTSTNTFPSTMCMEVLDCTCCQIILMHGVIALISSGSPSNHS
jgi:hypothetical protein